MTTTRRLSVLTIRLMRLGTVVKEFQIPLPSVTGRTTNCYGKEIDTGTHRKLV
jgi:hypothetical protein